ncbi:MAG: type VI secretion protein IcmF/TssM N-terminal domain-containing protein, partial [Planctomycetota bacterium]
FAAARKKREHAFEDELAASAGGSAGVSGAAAKARVDELRTKFQTGVDNFRKHGKSPYSVPWYVIVGEPGAGKTEAIRNSMIGFPPGLQDELQGSGGTLNMDWWFTNHAVILDTAGRMLFEEAGAKSSQEWREFLKLLTKARPNCPLNGVMLCIPADSLIKDSIDEVDTKAANIASKLSLIQRELDVRFPVFVVITKADLVNGFREFFDSIDDPQLQHQMVGWSNPAPLDEPFRAEEVEDHLLDMQDRLVKRRMGLMYDPGPREGGSRVDEVDAMYAFPEALVNLAPNLERYLETIFQGGEWAQQPLFMRGIYFASAMQEGSALDSDLAKSLGVSVDQLPEGSIWERQRSYFLRDLFIEKMFRERGLVTRASNAMKQKASRRLALRVFVAAAAVLLMVLTWFGYNSLKRSIGDQREFWASAGKQYGSPPGSTGYPVMVGAFDGPLGKNRLQYQGRKKIPSMGDADEISETFEAAYDASQDKIRVSPVFFVASLLAPDSTTDNLFRGKRERAAQVVFSRGVIEPIAIRALDALKNEDAFGDREINALAQLIRVYRSTEEDPPETRWSDLGAYVLRAEGNNLNEDAESDPELGAAGFTGDADAIDVTFRKLVDMDDNDAWPRDAFEALAGSSLREDDVERLMRRIGAPRVERARHTLDHLVAN